LKASSIIYDDIIAFLKASSIIYDDIIGCAG